MDVRRRSEHRAVAVADLVLPRCDDDAVSLDRRPGRIAGYEALEVAIVHRPDHLINHRQQIRRTDGTIALEHSTNRPVITRVIAEKDADGRTALTEAAFYGRTEIAKMLLDKGADVFAKKNDGATPLTMAASHKEIAEMIQQEIQLLEAAGKGDNAMVKELLDKGAYVNMRDPEGRTPLTEATWNNHVETVKLLLDKGANPNASKVDGATPLSIAATKRYREIMELLKKAGAK